MICDNERANHSQSQVDGDPYLKTFSWNQYPRLMFDKNLSQKTPSAPVSYTLD